MISVVIPNYNGEHIIKPCLEALLHQSLKGIEIIVIDNASTDNSPSLIKTYPVEYIQNTINVGFAKAVNQGIKAAKYPYVFLLNSDVVICEETLAVLLAEICKDERLFSVQPKMMQFYNQELIDDAGDIYTPFGWAFQLGHGLPDKYYNERRITFSCCAGAALYRKSIFDVIGYFDETFFAYMEDVDIGFRANNAGYYNLYIPSTKVFHIGSASFGKTMTELRSKLSGQNNVKVIRNNMGWPLLVCNGLFIGIGFFIKWLRFISLGKGKAFKSGMMNGRNDLNYIPPRKWYNQVRVQVLIIQDLIRFTVWRIRLIKYRMTGD